MMLDRDYTEYTKIIDLIYSVIFSDGGDGDAVWLVKSLTLDTVAELITEYDEVMKTGWSLIRKDRYFLWGIDQEWAVITDDWTIFDVQPSWASIKIVY